MVDLVEESEMFALSVKMQTMATRLREGELERDENLQWLGEIFRAFNL